MLLFFSDAGFHLFVARGIVPCNFSTISSEKAFIFPSFPQRPHSAEVKKTSTTPRKGRHKKIKVYFVIISWNTFFA